jgi:hypothetical protein
MTIDLKCECGSLKGIITEVSPTLNRRTVCLCRDCQAYAHYLGGVQKILDENGGTDVTPFHPAKIQLTEGLENLDCVRLSSDGMIRWFAKCCKTPIANSTPNAKIPFAGVMHTIFDFSKDPWQREQKLGPITRRMFGKYGIGKLPPGTHMGMPPEMMFSTLKFALVGLLKGLSKPSPFFDARTGKPTVEPKVLSDAEYDVLISKCGPGASA